jgi:hypothetical protein
MGVPTSELGYTSATTGRGDHEVHKGHVVALKKCFSNNACEREVQSTQKILRNVNFLDRLYFFPVHYVSV